MSTEPEPLALEAVTSDPARPPSAPASDGLTVAEAAATYSLSVSTVRRLLATGKLAGAHKVPGPKGAEYRIPPGALEALGYSAAATGPATVRTAAVEAELESLRARLAANTSALEATRHELDLVRQRAELLAASLEDMRAALRRLPELPPPAASPATSEDRRRWWRRR